MPKGDTIETNQVTDRDSALDGILAGLALGVSSLVYPSSPRAPR